MVGSSGSWEAIGKQRVLPPAFSVNGNVGNSFEKTSVSTFLRPAAALPALLNG
jgi:hypothetical protein